MVWSEASPTEASPIEASPIETNNHTNISSMEQGVAHKGQKGFGARLMSPMVLNILVGDAFHNIFDGIAIASAFSSCNGKLYVYIHTYIHT